MIKRPIFELYSVRTKMNMGTPNAPPYSLQIKLQIKPKFCKFGGQKAYERRTQRLAAGAKKSWNCINLENCPTLGIFHGRSKGPLRPPLI